jgi:hypothetical protein
MRSVRCDACGAKAMTAAAKCPKCSHLLDLRDGFGELLPLAYCSSCDSYYPERLGECTWCHTKPERPPIDAKIWRGVGAGVAAVIGSVWLIGNLTSSDAKRPGIKTGSSAVARKQVRDSSAESTMAATPTNVAAATDSAPVSDPGGGAAAPSTSPATDIPGSSAPIVLPQAAAAAVDPVNEPAIVQPVTAMPRTAQSKEGVVRSVRRAPSHWVRSVSRDWVVIRSGASRSSKIVASIGPNSRVDLGESRGTWRRLRTKGVAGWVEPRNLFDVARAR